MTSTTLSERTRSFCLKSLLAAGASTAALAIGAPAFAQEDDAAADASEDRIVVTGSRIERAGLSSSSPITSVGRQEFTLANTVNSEQFLNTLPQTVPGFDSSSNNPGTGEATVDLRGLGAVRTLVLVNGRRYVTSSQSAAVDLNTIPTALVENVDILTGGASAIYGSDAMAGVVNFTLRDDFEGLEIDTSYETSQEGDAGIFNTSLTFGSNFDDGRGNIVFNLGYNNRESLLQGDRDEAFFTLNDNGSGFSETGSVNVPSTFLFTPGSTVDYTEVLGINPPCDVEGTQEALDDDDNPLGFCTTDSFGVIFSPDGPGVDVFVNSGPNTNRYNYAPVNYLQLPQERYTVFTSGSYEFSEMVEFYGQAVYVSSQTEQLLAPTPVFTTITINVDNPFLDGDTEALALINQLSGGTDADGDGVDDVSILAGRRFKELGGRSSFLNSNSFQAQGGVRGDLSETWSYDIFGSFAQNNVTITQTGNVNVPNYQQAVRDGTLNIFDDNAISPSSALTIFQTGNITGQTEQTVISASVSGADFGLASPMAEDGVAVAGGFEYREEALSTIGAGLGSDVAGFNQAPDVFGRFDVYEVFGEVNAPIIQGAPLVEDLTLTGAYRYSDYSTVGGISSYAGGVSWTPVGGFRFRAQFQRAVRAPNIIELFQPIVNGFPNIEDPCSGGLGGFDAFDAATQATVTANCTADGVPTAAVGTPFQANAQIEGLFGGNPDLDEETADTFTLGVVLEPAAIPGLVITADYYDIEIEDVIGTVPSQTIFDLCYVDGVGEFCGLITRSAAGPVQIFQANNVNSALLATDGVDLSLDYSMDLGGLGTLSIYSLANVTFENSFQSLPTEASVDCAGFYAPPCGEPTPNWSVNTRFDWELGDFGARLRWQRISSVDDITDTGQRFVPGVDAYDQVDLTGFWQATDEVFLSVGIENLFDTDYVLIGDASAEQSNTFPATYDTIGRTFFARAVLQF
ncbi:MAG: TonB-dependent receptor [Pseudomonadota bacterium]